MFDQEPDFTQEELEIIYSALELRIIFCNEKGMEKSLTSTIKLKDKVVNLYNLNKQN